MVQPSRRNGGRVPIPGSQRVSDIDYEYIEAIHGKCEEALGNQATRAHSIAGPESARSQPLYTISANEHCIMTD